MWLLTKFGHPQPWDKDEVHVYVAKLRKELKDHRFIYGIGGQWSIFLSLP
jgi:hypothetical protein